LSSIVPGGAIPPPSPQPVHLGQPGIGNPEMESERDADGRHLPGDRRYSDEPTEPDTKNDPAAAETDTRPRRRSHDPTGQRGGQLDLDC
jgi:hypothetical protein